MKKVFFLIFCLLVPMFFLNAGTTLLVPEKEIKFFDYTSYGSFMFFLPEKQFFVFGMKKGFMVIDNTGKVIKRYSPQFQSPGSLIGLFNFFKFGNKYYAVGINKVLILNKKFEFMDSLSQCSICGGGVCWVNADKSFLCLSTFSGLEWRGSKGGLIKRNEKLINRIGTNRLSYYFNDYLTFIDYPLLYVLNKGSLKFFTIDMRNLNLLKEGNLNIPENFNSAFLNDRNVNIGMDIRKCFKETAGYGKALSFKVDKNYIAVCWTISGTENRYLTVYSTEGKVLRQFKLEKAMETTYPRAVFHPKKSVLYDYDYIESEDGNDYGLIRVYNFSSYVNKK